MKYPKQCPHCGAKLVIPAGQKNDKVLIIGEFPGYQEIKLHQPWVGQAGQTLRAELALLGFDFHSTRRTNLWLHAPNKNKDCMNFCFELAIEEMKQASVVLACGSDVAKFLTIGKYGVSELCGLILEPDDQLLIDIPFVIFTINPAQVLRTGGVGELKFALKKFVAFAQEYIDE